jgi:hypothetical protein
MKRLIPGMIILIMMTSTPLQALVMLNDPQLIEAAETLAYNTLNDSNLSEEEGVVLIFRKLTSRFPKEDEKERLLDFLYEAEKTFDESKEVKTQLILDKYQNSDMSLNKLYAYTVLTSLVINLDEAIVKG